MVGGGEESGRQGGVIKACTRLDARSNEANYWGVGALEDMRK
jgi:hypothetical protein